MKARRALPPKSESDAQVDLPFDVQSGTTSYQPTSMDTPMVPPLDGLVAMASYEVRVARHVATLLGDYERAWDLLGLATELEVAVMNLHEAG